MSSARIDDSLQALLRQLDQLPGGPGQAEHELGVWRVVAAGADERASRLLLAEALGRGQLDATVSHWDPRQRESHESVELSPLRRTVSWRHPVDGGEMILIPAGKALLGPEPQRVATPGLSLARFPVTNDQFHQFLASRGYQPERDDEEFGEFLSHWVEGRSRPRSGREDHPVVRVSIADALAYCEWTGARLPNQMMWERAARGSDGRKFPWGNEGPWGYFSGPGPRSKLAHLGIQDTQPVGSFPETRSPYGCEDLTGNVSQWCQSDDPDSVELWPVRGACFYRRTFGAAMASHPRRLNPKRRNQWVGFRICVC